MQQAPYYAFLAVRKQRLAMRNGQAIASGCGGQAGGTVYCQRHTAQHKFARYRNVPPVHAPHTPKAVRTMQPKTITVPVLVASGRSKAGNVLKGAPTGYVHNGVPVTKPVQRWRHVQTIGTVVVVP